MGRDVSSLREEAALRLFLGCGIAAIWPTRHSHKGSSSYKKCFLALALCMVQVINILWSLA